MLRQRALVVLLLLPILLWLILRGGWAYTAAIGLILSLAALEYARLFQHGSYRPSLFILLAAVLSQSILRHVSGFEHTAAWLVSLALISMTWHLLDFERGAGRSGSDFAVTLAGGIYLGWIGSYLVSLRDLAQGHGWVLLALISVWAADSAAYFVGGAYGRRQFSPRLSPKKTWEGYLAGLVGGSLGGALVAFVWGLLGEPAVGLAGGLLMGFLLAAVTPLGDLGISMMKRELKQKDTGALLPGHGGALDRIDTWLWAGVLGFYLAPILVTT